jgi:hypothetical protein
MLKQRSVLFDLCRCLRKEPPTKSVDWMAVIELANRSGVTPALGDFVTSCPAKVPQDLRDYLDEIVKRNNQRNDLLAAQLFEVAAQLNTKGIVPTLLKGTALLANGPRKSEYRLMTDLDIAVLPTEMEEAQQSLIELGYRFVEEASFGHSVVMERREDAGQIDLHSTLPSCGRLDLLEMASELLVHDGARVKVFKPTYAALVLIYHDQFQERDYWTARIDLRHLLDLRQLIQSPDGVDWRVFDSLPSNSFVRNNIETQLTTLQQLLGVNVPDRFLKRMMPRFQYWRRSRQMQAPAGRIATFLVAFLADLPGFLKDCYQTEAQRIARNVTRPTWNEPTWRFLVRIVRIIGRNRESFGKI